MSEADELARRFFALWSEYLTALCADPQMAEQLGHWLELAAGALRPPAAFDGAAGAPSGSPPIAAAAAGPSGERDRVVAELARRVDELAERIAVLERAGQPERRRISRVRSRDRPLRS